MLSDWHVKELQKAISGYRETIASLEDIKVNVRPCDRNETWRSATEARILHLKQSITSLKNILGIIQIANPPVIRKI
jgi:hypothetical protein